MKLSPVSGGFPYFDTVEGPVVWEKIVCQGKSYFPEISLKFCKRLQSTLTGIYF